MSNIDPQVNAADSNEQGRRWGWRQYVGAALGVAALGTTAFVVADPESARAFGESMLDALTPNFGPLFDNPVIAPQNGGPVMGG